jgi:transcriptional regulator with XRE-family HTH domain
MPDPTPVPPEQLAEVLRKHRDEHIAQRTLAKEYGVSQPTIARWVKTARENELWVDAIDRAEERSFHGDTYRELWSKVSAWLDKVDGPDDGLPVVDRILKISKSARELYGLDAPTRLAIESDVTMHGGRPAAPPDASLIATLNELDEYHREDERLIRQGQRGLVEQNITPRRWAQIRKERTG